MHASAKGILGAGARICACSGAGIRHAGTRVVPEAAALPWSACDTAAPILLWPCGAHSLPHHHLSTHLQLPLVLSLQKS